MFQNLNKFLLLKCADSALKSSETQVRVTCDDSDLTYQGLVHLDNKKCFVTNYHSEEKSFRRIGPSRFASKFSRQIISISKVSPTLCRNFSPQLQNACQIISYTANYPDIGLRAFHR